MNSKIVATTVTVDTSDMTQDQIAELVKKIQGQSEATTQDVAEFQATQKQTPVANSAPISKAQASKPDAANGRRRHRLNKASHNQVYTLLNREEIENRRGDFARLLTSIDRGNNTKAKILRANPKFDANWLSRELSRAKKEGLISSQEI